MLPPNRLAVVTCLLHIVVASPGLFDRAGCNADNCLRAVRASASLSSRMEDCSANAIVTVTPCPVTITGSATTISTLPTLSTTTYTTTTTTTGTTTITTSSVIELPRRAAALEAPVCSTPATFTPPAPTYATACSGLPRYSSACSCLGITASTTILEPVTVYATNTLSLTETPLATETITSTSTSTSITVSTCNPRAALETTKTPSGGHCGCTYNIDFTADYTYNSYYAFDHSSASTTTTEGCLATCERFGDCAAFVFDPSIEAPNCMIISNNRVKPATISSDVGCKVVGFRADVACGNSACDISTHPYYA